jgi:hypothetical protein
MKNFKSPGVDGFTVEFYNFFWNDIKIPLVKCLNESLDNGKCVSLIIFLSIGFILFAIQADAILKSTFKCNGTPIFKKMFWFSLFWNACDQSLTLANREFTIIKTLI